MLEKLNAQSTVVKVIIAVVIAAVLAGGVYYGVVSGKQEENKRTKAQLDTKVKENNELKQYESKLPDLDRQILQLKAQMEYQKQIVPDEKEADNFITLLQEQASNANINLRKIEAKATANKEYYTEVPFAIEVDGPFYGMVNFFERLGNHTRIVNVDGLNMKSTAKGAKYPISPSDSVVVNATAKTFYSREITIPPAETTDPKAKGKGKTAKK